MNRYALFPGIIITTALLVTTLHGNEPEIDQITKIQDALEELKPSVGDWERDIGVIRASHRTVILRFLDQPGCS